MYVWLDGGGRIWWRVQEGASLDLLGLKPCHFLPLSCCWHLTAAYRQLWTGCCFRSHFLIAGGNVYAPRLIKWIRRFHWWPPRPLTGQTYRRAEGVKKKGAGCLHISVISIYYLMQYRMTPHIFDNKWWWRFVAVSRKGNCTFTISRRRLYNYTEVWAESIIQAQLAATHGPCFSNLCSHYVLARTFFSWTLKWQQSSFQ